MCFSIFIINQIGQNTTCCLCVMNDSWNGGYNQVNCFGGNFLIAEQILQQKSSFFQNVILLLISLHRIDDGLHSIDTLNARVVCKIVRRGTEEATTHLLHLIMCAMPLHGTRYQLKTSFFDDCSNARWTYTYQLEQEGACLSLYSTILQVILCCLRKHVKTAKANDFRHILSARRQKPQKSAGFVLYFRVIRILQRLDDNRPNFFPDGVASQWSF
mmetsp:Transcript_13724/g.26180  ORF Transcript_13724/g.26180 Transcript_13724/m.26180 type:complete len:215 (-) Transcript_13724:2064-2708(-)